MSTRGLHETLITAALEAQLSTLGVSLVPDRAALRPAEAADRLALHLGRLLRQAIESFPLTRAPHRAPNPLAPRPSLPKPPLWNVYPPESGIDSQKSSTVLPEDE